MLNFLSVCHTVCAWFLILLGLVSSHLPCPVPILKNVMRGTAVLSGEYLTVTRSRRSWGCAAGCAFVRPRLVRLVNHNVMRSLCLVLADNPWICTAACNPRGSACSVQVYTVVLVPPSWARRTKDCHQIVRPLVHSLWGFRFCRTRTDRTNMGCPTPTLPGGWRIKA